MKPSALVIEDDEDLAYLHTLALSAAQYETKVVADGRAAMVELSRATPFLVLLDLNLPYVSGIEILQHIRSNPRLTHTQVILTTANPHTADIMKDEADLVLLKPISFSQLRDLSKRVQTNLLELPCNSNG